MKKIRMKIFETNSSSVHSLVIAKDMLEDSYLKIYKDGKIHIKPLYFSENIPFISTQEEKLAYLITQVCYRNNISNPSDIEDDYEFGIISDTICEYTGAKGIKVLRGEAYLNHQVVDDDFICDIYCKDSLLSFIFGKGVMVKQWQD